MVKNLIFTRYLKKVRVQLLIVCLLVLPTFYSLIRPGFFPMQDDLQAFRIHQMSKCIEDMQIPCYWIPDMGYQYGYPQFLFYSPSVYYLGAVIHLLGLQIIDVVKILFALGFVFGALAMFGFLNSFLGKRAAFFGVILYSFVPFKAAQVYVRGSLSEFWAAIFFPLLFWFSMDLIRKKEKKYGLFFTIAVAGLLVTHNLMSFIFIPILSVWILLWLYFDRFKSVVRIFIYGILGVGIASFFIVPLLMERSLVHTESLLGGYFDYRQHFVNLEQLFISNYWGYGSSVLGDNDEVTLSVGILQWVFAALGIFGIIRFYKKNMKLAVIFAALGFLELVILFMMHQKSSFIWSLIPSLYWLQFPWRFLAVSGFLLAILGSAGIYSLSNSKRAGFGTLAIVVLFVTSLLLYGRFYTPKEWYSISDQDKFSGKSWEKQLTISIFDYLPKSATFPPNKKAPDLPEVLEGEVRINNYEKSSNYQTGQFAVLSQKALVRFPLYDFYGMKLWVDGVERAFWHNECRGEDFCFGLMTTELTEGTHRVKIGMTITPDRQAGNIITLLSIILLAVYFKKEKKYVKD